MFRRHIDFVAVFIIAVIMTAFSELGSLKLPDLRESVHFQNALVSADSCPTTRAFLALFDLGPAAPIPILTRPRFVRRR